MRKIQYRLISGVLALVGVLLWAQLMSAPVSAQTVVELPLGDNFLTELPTQELSWGLLRSAPIYFDRTNLDLRYFMLYRDATTRRPVSVSSVI